MAGDEQEEEEELRNYSDDNFIDDIDDFHDKDAQAYRLVHDSRDLQDAFKDQSMGEELGLCSVPENYTPDSFDEIGYEKRKELKNLLMT